MAMTVTSGKVWRTLLWSSLSVNFKTTPPFGTPSFRQSDFCIVIIVMSTQMDVSWSFGVLNPHNNIETGLNFKDRYNDAQFKQ